MAALLKKQFAWAAWRIIWASETRWSVITKFRHFTWQLLSPFSLWFDLERLAGLDQATFRISEATVSVDSDPAPFS